MVEKEITGITVTYTDGGMKELTRGCCVDLSDGKSEEMHVEMLNVEMEDIVQLAYGLLVCVKRMGMMDDLFELSGDA